MCGIAFALRCSDSSAAEHGRTREDNVAETLSTIHLAKHEHEYSGPITSCNGSCAPVHGGKLPVEAVFASEQLWQVITDAVRPRGPDASADHIVRSSGRDTSCQVEICFHSSVLHMRGNEVTPQPFVDPVSGDVLLWNGEVFDGMEVSLDENDGLKLFRAIQSSAPEAFLSTLRPIEGPYAFVYYQHSTQRLWFGRDHLGRRSLLLHRPTPTMPLFVLASNASSTDQLGSWEEVACDAVHCFDIHRLQGVSLYMSYVLRSFVPDSGLTCSIVAWGYHHPAPPSSKGNDIIFRHTRRSYVFLITLHCTHTLLSQIYPYDPLLKIVPKPDQLPSPTPSSFPDPSLELENAISDLEAALELSIRQRTLSVPSFPPSPTARIAVLFSGGLDCTTLARLLDRVLDKNEAIDLINVAFENPRTLQSKHSERTKVDGARKKKKATRKDDEAGEEEVLVQVEDEPRIVEGSRKETDVESLIYDVPDRLTGRASWQELRRVSPKRWWNFVEVNVPYQEMLENRPTVIDLMRPQRTVMDLSISLAFYFAARGKGQLAPTDLISPPTAYHSQARVLLSGLGADELLGGYARHRKAYYTHFGGRAPSEFHEGSWAHLIEEMQMDLDRLPTRNLGRDDRIISIHGKEARYPFLAAHVVDFCSRTPIWLKCDPRLGEGTGDKMLLRMLAKKLGLGAAARLKKRAVHFGARTAKMELGSGKDKGEDELEY